MEKSARIFLVEDEASASLAIEQTLTRLGFESAGAAATGFDAVARVTAARPDAVLMDISLRGEHGGVEIARRIRAQLDIPIVFLTAHAGRDTLDRAKIAGFGGCIAMPCGDREIQLAIEFALCKHGMEMKNRRLEHWLSATLRSIGDAVIATDRAGRIAFMNPVSEKLTGWPAGEAIGRELGAVFRIVHETSREPVEDFLTRVPQRQDGAGVDESMLLLARDGTEAPIGGSAAPIRHEGDEAFGAVIVFRDMREQRGNEEQIRHLQRLDSIGQVAAGVAHDFNNVLNVINGHTALLSSEPDLSPRALESTDEIALAVKRASNLTRQLLSLSRQQEMRREPLILDDAMVVMTRMFERVLGEDIAVDFRPSGGQPIVEADAAMLEQAILNLAINARDAMGGRGSLCVRTGTAEFDESIRTRVPHARPGLYAWVSIRDSGPGMDAATVAKIFDPFFTTKEKGCGTGLGLSTVNGIVKQHFGWVDVESSPGAGTNFTLYFPASLRFAADGAEITDPPPADSRRTILIAEDDESLLLVLSRLLEMRGFKVVGAADGAAAMDRWTEVKGNVDVLISDLRMPSGIGGRQLTERLMALKPGLRVILISGYLPTSIENEFAASRSLHVLHKPFDPGDLIDLLEPAAG